jgi:hypothetical protein
MTIPNRYFTIYMEKLDAIVTMQDAYQNVYIKSRRYRLTSGQKPLTPQATEEPEIQMLINLVDSNRPLVELCE